MAASIKVTGIASEFANAEADLIKTVNQLQRASSLSAVSHLQITTPVDTGRARGSWTMNKTGTARDTGSANLTHVPTVSLLGPIPSNHIETIYITNGTPYIQDLNSGSSLQSPPRFIENTLSKYFTLTAGSVKFT